MSLTNYDAWLEEPYQSMYEDSDKFIEWAEDEGYDFDDPEDMDRAQRDYEDWLYSMAESWAEDAYERTMEARYDLMMMEREMDEKYWGLDEEYWDLDEEY